MQFLNLKLLVYCIYLKLCQLGCLLLLRQRILVWEWLRLLTTKRHLSWKLSMRLTQNNTNSCVWQLWLWNWFSFCFGIMCIDIILQLKVVSIVFFKLVCDLWKELSNSTYHVFPHVFNSVLLKNLTWHLLLFILHSMNEVTKVTSLTPNRSMIVFARHSSIIAHFYLNLLVFLLFFLQFFLVCDLLFFNLDFLKLADLVFEFLQVLLDFKSKRNN